MERHFLLREQRLKLIAGNLNGVYSPLGGGTLPSVAEMCANVSDGELADHLVICPVCGQMLDCRDKAQVAHHNGEQHQPKLARPRSPRLSQKH